MPVAVERINFGRHGHIEPGDEVPATFVNSRGQVEQTDFESLAARGLVTQETPAPKPVAKRRPRA